MKDAEEDLFSQELNRWVESKQLQIEELKADLEFNYRSEKLLKEKIKLAEESIALARRRD